MFSRCIRDQRGGEWEEKEKLKSKGERKAMGGEKDRKKMNEGNGDN